MNFGSWLIDKKIRGLNLSADLTVEEYWRGAEDILIKNEYQRRRVQTKGNAYALLKRDLLQGCIMPPIILAVTEKYGENISDLVNKIVDNGVIDDNSKNLLDDFISDSFQNKELIILDGLQRSFIIKSALEEANESELANLKKHKIRVEIYLGLSKMGILYRMLTLNTGQTPMSFRHQLEMLYHDYLNKDDLPDGIVVLREIDESRARGLGKYKYSDVIDLFYSYSTGTAQSIDKETLVSKLKELDFLEKYTPESEDMLVLLQVYNKFVSKVSSISNNWETPNGIPEGKNILRPFGVNVDSIFSKAQPMTGFGCACSRLVKSGIYNKIQDIYNVINTLSFKGENPEVGLGQLIMILDEVSNKAKRIGDAQRAYFELAFRELLNPGSDSFSNLSNCWITAQEKYNILY